MNNVMLNQLAKEGVRPIFVVAFKKDVDKEIAQCKQLAKQFKKSGEFPKDNCIDNLTMQAVYIKHLAVNGVIETHNFVDQDIIKNTLKKANIKFIQSPKEMYVDHENKEKLYNHVKQTISLAQKQTKKINKNNSLER